MKKTILSLMAVVALMCSTGCSKGGEPKPDPKSVKTYEVNGVKFNMVNVKGGTFTMGAADEDTEADPDEKPAHAVTLSNFAIGETEVTQELWEAVMGSNPSYYKEANKPVVISWNDCQKFIAELNKLTGKKFRMPTEAEWEYAARGGEKSKGYIYSGSNTLSDVAWYENNSNYTTHPVKTKSPNELGLYDMSGNVCEWCSDWFGSYSSATQTNPTGPVSGSHRVIRGGDWECNPVACRVSWRDYTAPDKSFSILGLRLAQ